MANYGFEYFCGANVTVSIQEMPVLEAAGISYQIEETKMPLYGYSSRHYDAVARGQVLVRGTLLINFVHQDYLFKAIQLGTGHIEPEPIQDPLIPVDSGVARVFAAESPDEQMQIANQMKKFWTNEQVNEPFSPIARTYSPHDVVGGVDIDVVFGSQSYDQLAGVTALRLVDVNFTGRSNAIRIDEDVIVEAYPFFARDVFSLRNKPPEPNP